MQSRSKSRLAPKRTSVPAWMRDRAALEQIQRARLLEAGVPANQILSPGTQRLARVLDQAFEEFHARLAAEDGPVPF